MSLEAIAGLLLAATGVTAAITRWLTRWQITRSAERRDVLAQLQAAHARAVERIAHVEGRADEQSRAVLAAQDQLATAREALARAGAEIEHLRARVAQLETEREQLRQRIATLEAERDELAAKLGGRRRPTPSRPMPALTDAPLSDR